MFSILNILKKYQQEKQALKESKAPCVADQQQLFTPDPAGGQIQPPAQTQPAAETQAVNVSVYTAVTREVEDERLKLAQKIYTAAVAWAKKIYSLEITTGNEFKTGFLPFVSEAVNAYNIDDKDFLCLCVADYGQADDYIYAHAVNVAFISLELARGMNYSSAKLCELFCSAFMHDIGITQYVQLINKKSALSSYEFGLVKEHPAKGLEVLDQIGGEFSPGIKEVISQEHERMDGTGYPCGLKEGQISEQAMIVALADTYESLTHSRPYRPKITPPEAVNKILNQKSLFGMSVLKQLLERIGIFPAGTRVRLNTKETGVVIRNNKGLPLRPVVQVLFTDNGSKLLQPKSVDLASNLLISIEECLESQCPPG
jgi:HD-GYP domain-containing protein (c-di-GMP phosphodiesterase class II)